MKAPVQAEGLKSAASSSEKEEAVNKVEREGSSADKPITDSNALMLSPESLAKVNEEAVRESPDALIGVHEGDETLLNTREFKYAAFFNRVKAAVAMHWHPQEAGQRHESVYGLLGERTRVTVLEVVLDADGGLVGTRVQISSGLPFLDEEAQQAFVRSAPFLHPPAALLDPESRRIAFRFGFYIESTRLF
jgi:TonB family protein